MSVDYGKLKTNLNLIMHRLKLVEKKKMELNQKARRTIGEFLNSGKVDRARIRVEQIIREDYVIEAMDLVESYCDFLLSRFGQLQNSKVVDDSLSCAVSSLIWVTPRFESDIPELKVIAEQLARKYGKPYVQAICDNHIKTVNETLMKKMGTEVPSRVLVEKYLVEIAKDQKIDYKPDPRVLKEQEMQFSSQGFRPQNQLDSSDEENLLHQPAEAPQSGFSLIDLGDHYPRNPITQPFSAYGQPAPPLPSEPPIAPDILNQINDTVDHASAPSDIPIGFNLSSLEETTGSSASMTEKPARKTETGRQHNKPESTSQAGASSSSSRNNKQEAGQASGEGPPPNYDSVVNKTSDNTQYFSFGPDSTYVNHSPDANDTLPELPPVPKPTTSAKERHTLDEAAELDELTRRFEDLKK